jgi:uncharacterized coiled-coil protein SlyX
VQELIRAAEAQTGVRPRRRPDLVQKRIAAQQDLINRTQRLLEQQQQTLTRLRQTHTELIGKVYHAEALLKEAISAQKSARLQPQVTSWRRRLPRLETQMATCQQVIAKHQTRLTEQQTILNDLQAWRVQLDQENQTNLTHLPTVKPGWMRASLRAKIVTTQPDSAD